MIDKKTKYIKQFLKANLIVKKIPRGKNYYSVSDLTITKIAQELNSSLLEIMIFCLQENIWPERFYQNLETFNAKEQIKLLTSSISIIGLGGLGGFVALILARLGVGNLILVDKDIFQESNLNRQFLANQKTLGKSKALITAKNIQYINPAINIQIFPIQTSKNNLFFILKNTLIAIDCLDNLSDRYILEKVTRQINIPLIHASIAGLEGLLMIVWPHGPKLKALYGTSALIKKNNSAEHILGIPAMTPAIMASFQVTETIKILLNRPTLSAKTVLHVDLETLTLDHLYLR